jgi:hypothetical protein
MLRDRLLRFLPTGATPVSQPPRPLRPPLSDSQVVELLANLQFAAGSDIETAKVLYAKESQAQIAQEGLVSVPASSGAASQPSVATVTASPPASDVSHPVVSAQIIPPPPPNFEKLSPPPSFEQLVQQGWIRTSWGRFTVPRDIMMALSRSDSKGPTAFRSLLKIRTQDQWQLTNPSQLTGVVLEAAQSILDAKSDPGEVHCISRAWIAARLWDSLPSTEANGTTAEQRLQRWIDRWTFLSWPVFALSALVESVSVDEFTDAALAVLTATDTSPGWEEFRSMARNPVVLLYPHRARDNDSIVPPLPRTTIERVSWLSRGEPEVAFHDLLGDSASNLLAMLLNELQEAPFDPRRLAPRLMGLVVQRPAYLQQLVLRAQRSPALLADMLMAPATCPLACSLIASWEARGSGWNRDFQAAANQATALLAFEDAIALLRGHLDDGNVSADELAALYLHLYQLATDPRQSSRHYSQLTLLRELAGASPSLQDSVVAALLTRAQANDSPLDAFCASLDLASEGGCADRIDATTVVSTYADVLIPRGQSLSVRQMEVTHAQTLVALAFKNDATRNRLIAAVDVASWLGVGPPLPQETHTYKHLLARRVRLQIRVLSRAIAGWPTALPDPLVEALARTLHVGATDQPQLERIDAFLLDLSLGMNWATQERPIAFDLAAALRRVEGLSLQRLITELCQVREPAVLAGIVANTPSAVNQQIKAHLLTLTPKTSSEVIMLPALQVRVEALLSAQLPDLAEVFVAAEREAIPGRVVPNRAITTLRSSLLALYIRENWSAIATFVLPESIPNVDKHEAQDALMFYRALAELKKPAGDAAAAEAMFLQLTQRNRAVLSYQGNLFASRLQRLLGGNTLGLLSGNNLSDAKRYLNEAQREVRPLLQHSAADLKALDVNRAILLLAAGRPRESLQLLLELRENELDSRPEGFRALALARLGSRPEALALLNQTERMFGRSDLISAIRENIDTNRPFAAAPSLSLDDDPVPGLRQAFQAFARLGHIEQSQVLQDRGQFELYVLEQVRGACASLVALAPMMRELGMVRYEDDITGVLKQLLLSRLLLVQWTVADQSRGGFSKTGGVGERDLVVSKGSATLAVIEALIVSSVETTNLSAHLNKLFGYDTCRLFFHLTYAQRLNCDAIIKHLKSACTTPPPGIEYVRSVDLEDVDSLPIGFIAHYSIGSRATSVAFLALEIGQPLQRSAAAAQ